ncbi:DUF6893 family small protein [Micromonospora olivasterospora]
MRKLLMLLAGAAAVSLFWKELPALRRYIKIEKM